MAEIATGTLARLQHDTLVALTLISDLSSYTPGERMDKGDLVLVLAAHSDNSRVFASKKYLYYFVMTMTGAVGYVYYTYVQPV